MPIACLSHEHASCVCRYIHYSRATTNNTYMHACLQMRLLYASKVGMLKQVHSPTNPRVHTCLRGIQTGGSLYTCVIILAITHHKQAHLDRRFAASCGQLCIVSISFASATQPHLWPGLWAVPGRPTVTYSCVQMWVYPCSLVTYIHCLQAQHTSAPVAGSLSRARQAHSTVSSSGGTPRARMVLKMRSYRPPSTCCADHTLYDHCGADIKVQRLESAAG